MTAIDIQPNSLRAHELYGDFWFNSEPVPISALRGKVILIHFWDYTCVHCRHGLPYINEWNRKYREHGLVVVGVHTPRFPFAGNPDVVQRMVSKLGITHPVVMDNGYIIASRYVSRTWPSFYLVDKHGYIRYQNTGGGNYEAAERTIQTLLYDAGVDQELPELMQPLRDEDRSGAVCYRATPELFTGYTKGSLGNVEGYSPESVVQYDDPEIYIEGRFYVDGFWLNEKNCLRLNESGLRAGHIMVSYTGNEVYAVITPGGQPGFEVELKQDGRFLDEMNKGNDVRIAGDGKSYLFIDEPGVFHLVKNDECGGHILKLTARNNGFSLYSLMFDSSVIPEMISNN